MKSASSLLCLADPRVLLRGFLFKDHLKDGEEHPEGDGGVDDHRDDIGDSLTGRAHRRNRPRVDRVFVENLKGGGCDRDDDVATAYQKAALPTDELDLKVTLRWAKKLMT